MIPAPVSDLLAWYKTSGIPDASLVIPAAELIFLFALLTICLLFRLSRTGLIIAYLATYRWGWLFCLHNVYADQKLRTMFLTGYIVFGILVLTTVVVAMLIASHRPAGE